MIHMRVTALVEVKLNEKLLTDMANPKWRSQIPFTMSHAINRTLIASRKEQQEGMDKHIEGGPTRFTRSSVRYKASNKRNLEGRLYYHGDAPYMKSIIDGGAVKAKKVKLSEPVNVKLDKFGNIPSGRGKNKYTARAKANKKFFFGVPRGRSGDQYRGIWRRYGKGGYAKLKRSRTGRVSGGKARGTIKLMVSWRRGQRNARPTFPAYEVFEAHGPQYLERQLKVSYRFAMRTAIKKQSKMTGF